MEQAGELAVLYDLAMAIGGETRLETLLARALDRLRLHSGLPAAVALAWSPSDGPRRFVLAHASGDAGLVALVGTIGSVLEARPLAPEDLRGAKQITERFGFPAALGHFGYAQCLPVDEFGVVLLLGGEGATSTLPSPERLRPILENLGRAIVLCRAYAAPVAPAADAASRPKVGGPPRESTVAALQESEAELKRAQKISNSGHWIGDLETNEIHWSDQAARILGVPPGEVGSWEMLAAVVHPDDLARLMTAWSDLLEGRSYEMDHRLVVGGAVRWVRSMGELERDAKGDPRRIHGAFMDITRIKETALALERREKIYRAVVDGSRLAVALIDPMNLHFVEFNDTAAELLGYTRDEFASLRATEIRPTDVDTSRDEQLRDAIERGRIEHESRVLRKDGTIIDVWVTITSIELDGRRYNAAVWLDISERKRMQAELERHRNHLEQLVERRTDEITAIFKALPDLYFRLDRDGTVLDYMTGSADRLLVPPETFLRRKITDVLPPEAAARCADALARVAAGDPMAQIEYELPMPNGVGTYEARLLPLVAHQVVAVIRDVSERRRTERALAAARDTAEAANRAKSAFLANISHEIRTPMNAIIGLTHLIRRETTHAAHREQLDKVAAAAHHLLSIINDLLDLSKIEAGKLQLESHDFEVEPLFVEVADLVFEPLQAKGLQLVIDIAEVPTVLTGDSLRLRQVLLNFCSNATKFTEVGYVRMRARVLETTGARLRLRFEVTDTGIGLSPEQRSRLFMPFEQADPSTTRKYGGTGLGLVIARRIADLMGGTVGCDSELGRGSTFWFEATFGLGAAVAPSTRSVAEGTRILLADGVEVAREASTRLLRSRGLDVDAVASSDEALETLARADATGRPHALLLFDADLPGGGAIETVHRMVASHVGTTALRLLVTSDAHIDPAAAMRAEFVGVLQKPLTATPLLGAIAAALRAEPAPIERAPVARAAELACAALASSRPIRALVVDDDQLNREVALELVRSVGIQADPAVDGRQALELARSRPYDIVLMDVQMPVMNGLEATQAIRTMADGHATTPILAMTASSYEEDREACLRAGMNDLVAKPFDPESLYAALLHWLGAGDSPRLPATRPPSTPPHPSLPLARDRRSTTPGASSLLAGAGSTSVVARLVGVDGLDVAIGLRSVRGKVESFTRLLSQFCANHREDMAKLEERLRGGDRTGARLFAHTLKGVAGALGMTSIQSVTTSLDLAFKSGAADADLIALARSLDDLLRRMVRDLERTLPGETHDSAPIDPGELRAGVEELRRRLAADEMSAVDKFRELRPGLGALDPTATGRLGRQIEGFAYADALITLDDLGLS